LSQNVQNIMKYKDIHLLRPSYNIVKYLCNIRDKKIHLYVYDIEDIEIFYKIFDDAIMENSITIRTNVTIYLYIGWFRDYSNKDLFLNYMNLILQMTRYKIHFPL